jgi:hypothetical protein
VPARSDVVQFDLNQPVEVALKFAEPKVIDTKYGERALYTLTDDRVMFHDLLTAAKIKTLGVQPGDCFHIVKRKKGRIQEFDVFRDAQEPQAPAGKPILVGEAVAQAAQQPIASNPVKKLPPPRDLARSIGPRKFAGNGDLAQQLEQSIAQAKVGHLADGTFAVPVAPERRPATVAQASARPAWTELLLSQTNHLVDCYAEALAHASKHGTAVKSDDVRNLLVTSFIQLAQKGGRNAA